MQFGEAVGWIGVEGVGFPSGSLQWPPRSPIVCTVEDYAVTADLVVALRFRRRSIVVGTDCDPVQN